MSCILHSVVLVTAVAIAGAGCRIATEYVPQTPGRAALGMENDAIGVYKNGTFTKLPGDMQGTFGCSTQAAGTASAAAERHRSYRINGWISMAGFDLAVLSPLLDVVAISLAGIGLGAGVFAAFLVRAENARGASVALAVDAINLHNDTPACLGSAPAAAGGPQ